MNTPFTSPLRSAIAVALFLAASAAHAQMYRWIDDQGSMTYSNQLPSDRSAARDLTIVDDGSTKVSPTEQRTREILLEAEREKSPGSRELTMTPDGALEVSPSPGAETQPQRAGIWPGQPETVRDPCLRSSDPKCPEKNRANYVPYRGYSPTAAREAAAIGVGGTSSAGAGGMLGGGAPPPPRHVTPPKASSYALPPGSEGPASAKR